MLGGEAAPAGLADDLTKVRGLPEGARSALWDLLGPNVGAQVTARDAAATARFCDRHQLTIDAVAPIARGCRLLLREAALRDAPVEDMFRDILELTGDNETARRLSTCYAKALVAIRAEMTVDTLASFGPVLSQTLCRVDYVTVTQHDKSAVVPVTMLSFRYKEEGADRQLTLQVSPQALAQLKRALGT